ncbi:hypothetical protein STRDD11_02340 [Streptococcus sp. DD11]|nr:hypothetical protein STRDD11_02340 [Streptococcus sp. DD11]
MRLGRTELLRLERFLMEPLLKVPHHLVQLLLVRQKMLN